jgi:2-aminoadipate transaminase
VPRHISTSFDNPLFVYATREEQVMYVPGDLCYTGPLDVRPNHQMRLSFGVLEPDVIDEAMKRLAKAVRRFVL